MRYLLVLVLLAGCQRSVLVEDPAAPGAGSVSEARVRTVLATRHFDADDASVRALGAGVAPLLVAMAEGEAESNVTRIRATLALRHQSGDAVEQALIRLARTSSLPALRRSSVDSLARAFGGRDPHTVIEVCASLQAHPDASVRRAATEAEMRARLAGARARP